MVGNTGKSATDVSLDGESNTVTYDQLIEYDGHIKVHLSSDEMTTIVAQGDIGGNELTETSVEYTLSEAAVTGISGTATFTKRKNGGSFGNKDCGGKNE